MGLRMTERGLRFNDFFSHINMNSTDDSYSHTVRSKIEMNLSLGGPRCSFCLLIYNHNFII